MHTQIEPVGRGGGGNEGEKKRGTQTWKMGRWRDQKEGKKKKGND